MATNFPPKDPNKPWENAFAVNSAELTKDLPSNLTDSETFPLRTLSSPLYGLLVPFVLTDIFSAIDLECSTVIFSVISLPSITFTVP